MHASPGKVPQCDGLIVRETVWEKAKQMGPQNPQYKRTITLRSGNNPGFKAGSNSVPHVTDPALSLPDSSFRKSKITCLTNETLQQQRSLSCRAAVGAALASVSRSPHVPREQGVNPRAAERPSGGGGGETRLRCLVSRSTSATSACWASKPSGAV
eukprot:766410-Hanusia_phi.AAC.1